MTVVRTLNARRSCQLWLASSSGRDRAKRYSTPPLLRHAVGYVDRDEFSFEITDCSHHPGLPSVDDLASDNEYYPPDDWVQPVQNDTLGLTPDGVRAQSALLEQVTAMRRQVVRGITDDEYRPVIDILHRMAANLEAETNQQGSYSCRKRSKRTIDLGN